MFKSALWRRKRPRGGDAGAAERMAAADLFHGLDAESDGGDDVSDWGDVVDEGVDEKRDGGGGGGGGRHAAVVQIDGERRMQSEGISGLPSRKKAKKAEDPSTSRKKSTPPAPVNSIGGSSKGARNGSDAKGSATGGSRLIMTSRVMGQDEAKLIRIALESGERIKPSLETLAVKDVAVSLIIEGGLGAAVKAYRGKKGEEGLLAAELTRAWKAKIADAMSGGKTEKNEEGRMQAGTISMMPRCGPNVAYRDDEGEKRARTSSALSKALGGAPGRARELEEALWARWGGEGDDGFLYSQAIKSFVSNLPKNAELRDGVRSGRVKGVDAAKLKPKEMADDGKKQLREATLTAAAFDDSMYITAKSQGAQTDKFTCPKCRKKDCSFYHEHLLPDNFWAYTNDAAQMMITCRLCGHEWRE